MKVYSGGVRLATAFSVWTDGTVQIPFVYLDESFKTSRDAREEFRRRINEAVPEANLPPETGRAYAPTFSLGLLSDEPTRLRFLEAVEWAFDEVRQAEVGAPRPSV